MPGMLVRPSDIFSDIDAQPPRLAAPAASNTAANNRVRARRQPLRDTALFAAFRPNGTVPTGIPPRSNRSKGAHDP
jgi:hypothetical protein